MPQFVSCRFCGEQILLFAYVFTPVELPLYALSGTIDILSPLPNPRKNQKCGALRPILIGSNDRVFLHRLSL